MRTTALSPILHARSRIECVSPAHQGHRPCPNPGGTVLFLSCCWALATAPHNPSLVQMQFPKFSGSARETHTLRLCKDSHRLLERRGSAGNTIAQTSVLARRLCTRSTRRAPWSYVSVAGARWGGGAVSEAEQCVQYTFLLLDRRHVLSMDPSEVTSGTYNVR